MKSTRSGLSVSAPFFLFCFVSLSSSEDIVKIRPFNFPKFVEEGEQVQIMCGLRERDKNVKFSWFKDGFLLEPQKGVKIISTDEFSVLTITDANSKSSGNYTCKAEVSTGRDDHTAELLVKGPLSWRSQPLDVSANLGDKVKFPCETFGFPFPRITWTNENDDLWEMKSEKETPTRVHVVKYGALVIETVKEEDGGLYTCKASNGIGEGLQKTIQLSIIAPLKIQPFNFPPNPPEETNIQVLCGLERGDMPVEFQWLKNDILITRGSVYDIAHTSSVSVLIIKNATVKSSGNYTCSVRGPSGKDTYTAELLIKGPPRWRTIPEDTVVGLKSPLQLPCNAYGYPTPTVHWTKGHPTKTGNTELEKSHWQTLLDGTLITDAIKYGDGGKYTCTISNGIGQNLQKTVHVTVRVPVKIRPFIVPKLVEEGEKVQMICGLEKGDGVVRFQWLKDGIPIVSEVRWTIVTHSDFSVLMINNTEVTNSGNYTCIGRNTGSKDSHTAMLSVQGPPTWKKTPTDVEAAIGESVVIQCSAHSFPSPSVVWTKNFKLPSDTAKENVQNFVDSHGTLRFNDIQREDGGYYTCIIENGIGSPLQKTIEIKIKVRSPYLGRIIIENVVTPSLDVAEVVSLDRI
ncbi:cell adhesion molecule DSCAM-like [Tachypleus tridentatus]|uniref:cell adhesion molecule DSCAM-like n=1 Tax=Tachypleus tridentatus TaxID=6853 RepID=UPI003FD15174